MQTRDGGGTGGLGAAAGGEVMLGCRSPGAWGATLGGAPWLLCPMLGAWWQERGHSSTTGSDGCPAAEPPAVQPKASVRVRDEGGNGGGPDPGLGFKEAGFSTSAGLPRGAGALWQSCFRSWAQSPGCPEHCPLPVPGEGSPLPGTAAPCDWSVLVARGGPGPRGS